ncbi:MAG: YbgA family protein [Crenarchaeota archaeon]|nr:YbgA family protein [Thermoproteota archaeon]HJJ21149.1 YbgA family protein [Nitrosopumilus sp.]MDA0853864.1 YbgA family protein [Thermoproteota archaeon]MDA1122746.1 YbgA family protein [Thermoproteota archaeon]HJJ24730.1 YbgA family protein [Nitrosopumilus sp.]
MNENQCTSGKTKDNILMELSENDIKLFVKGRFRQVKKSKKINELVEFHSMNKFLLMAHDLEQFQILERIVSNYNNIKLSEILIEYENHLKIALESSPTLKTHSSVLLHVFGFFSSKFCNLEKNKFFELFENYKSEKIKIGEILVEIHSIIYQLNKTYLASQTYFLLYANKEKENIFKILEAEEISN